MSDEKEKGIWDSITDSVESGWDKITGSVKDRTNEASDKVKEAKGKLSDSFADNKALAIGLGVAGILAVTGSGFGAILVAIAAIFIGASVDEKGIVKKTWDSFSDKKPDTPAAAPAETAAAPSTATQVGAKDAPPKVTEVEAATALPEEKAGTASKAAEYTHVFIDKSGNVLLEKQPNSIQVAIDKGGRISHYNEIGGDNRVTKNINDKPIEYIGKPIDLPMKDGAVDLKDPKTLREFKSIGELFNRGAVTQQTEPPKNIPTLAIVDSAPAVISAEQLLGKAVEERKNSSIVNINTNSKFVVDHDNNIIVTAGGIGGKKHANVLEVLVDASNGKVLTINMADKEGNIDRNNTRNIAEQGIYLAKNKDGNIDLSGNNAPILARLRNIADIAINGVSLDTTRDFNFDLAKLGNLPSDGIPYGNQLNHGLG